MRKSSKYIFIWIALLFTLCVHGQTERTKYFVDARWSTLHPVSISDNGNWVLINEIYPNKQENNRRYIVNIKGGVKVDIGEQLFVGWLNDNVFLGKDKGDLLFLNLNKTKETDTLKNIQQVILHNDLSKLSVLTNENKLLIYQYKQLRKRVILELDSITKVFEFKGNNQLFAVQCINGIHTLLNINVNSNKYTPIDYSLQAIQNITFNNKKDKVLIHYTENSFSVFDLLKREKYESPFLLDSIKHVFNFQVSFSLNDQLLISYHQRRSEIKSESLVDVKGSNTLDIGNSRLDWFLFTTVLFDYIDNKKLILDCNRDYLHLNLEEVLISHVRQPIVDYLKLNNSYEYFIENYQSINHPLYLTTSEKIDRSLSFNMNHTLMVYPNNDKWIIFDLNSFTNYDSLLKAQGSTVYWSDNTNYLIYQSSSGLYSYNVENKQTKLWKNLNYSEKIHLNNKSISGYSLFFDASSPLIFSITGPENQLESIISLYQSDVVEIYKNKSNRISDIKVSIVDNKPTIVFSEQNYKNPIRICAIVKNEKQILLENNTPNELFANRKQKIVSFKDRYNKKLNAVVYYPDNFMSTKKYPMISYIYEKLSHSKNVFNVPSLDSHDGFNISVFTSQGYFVSLIDTYVSNDGAGKTTVDCVESALAEITDAIPNVDKENLGVLGHSFGGYKVNYTITQTNLFKAAVSGAGVFDLLWETYAYNEHLERPNYIRIEGPQQSLGESFADNPIKYLENSPHMFVQNIQTPVLLWTGMHDTNVPWEHTRNFYTALKKYKKPVIALYFKNIDHSMVNKFPKEQYDLTCRIIDWFDYYLKGKKEITWISDEIQSKI